MTSVMIKYAAIPPGDSAGIAASTSQSLPPGMSAAPMPISRPPKSVRQRSLRLPRLGLQVPRRLAATTAPAKDDRTVGIAECALTAMLRGKLRDTRSAYVQAGAVAYKAPPVTPRIALEAPSDQRRAPSRKNGGRLMKITDATRMEKKPSIAATANSPWEINTLAKTIGRWSYKRTSASQNPKAKPSGNTSKRNSPSPSRPSEPSRHASLTVAPTPKTTAPPTTATDIAVTFASWIPSRPDQSRARAIIPAAADVAIKATKRRGRR